MSTCHRLDLQTLGNQTVMSQNLPDHCRWHDLGGGFAYLTNMVCEVNVDTSNSVESSGRWIRALEAWASWRLRLATYEFEVVEIGVEDGVDLGFGIINRFSTFQRGVMGGRGRELLYCSVIVMEDGGCGLVCFCKGCGISSTLLTHPINTIVPPSKIQIWVSDSGS